MAKPTGRKRGDAAVQLRLAGSSYDEIATTLGYRNGVAVRQVVEGALARGIDQNVRDQQRELAGRRIERLIRTVWAKANNPDHPEHLAAVREARELIGRHARLYGLDATPELIVRTPTDSELMRWVSDVLSYVPKPVQEADVLSGEIEEAEVVSEERHDEEATG